MWRPRRFISGIWLVVLTVLATTTSGLPAGAFEPGSVTQAALESIFSPRRAPARKSMGLLQRSFLDVVESSQTNLEVALVVDGTDSMAADIEAVRRALGSMVADLRRYKENHVKFQLVVYRDIGSPSGPITIPLKEFTDDINLLEQQIAAIQPESGAPYFPELVDLGVHEALSNLAWTPGPQTSRWIFVFGDAPPFDPGFDEAATGARRRFDTDLLVSLAQRVGVNIHCVLCASRPEEAGAFQQLLDKTRRFMNDLAGGSGGLMLDLSYPDIQKVLEESARKQRVEYSRIGRITKQDIDTARKQAEENKVAVAPSQHLRLAVLPHVPLDQMTFDPDRPEVQVSTELRQKLRQIPRFEVKSPLEVEHQLRVLQSQSLESGQQLQALATLLDVDYVVWGTYARTGSVVDVETAFYDRVSGKKVVSNEMRTSDLVPETHLAGRMVDKLVSNAVASSTDKNLSLTLAAFQRGKTAQELIRPVAATVEGRKALLAGLELLEQALALKMGAPQARPQLEGAIERLKAATERDPRDAYAQLLLANAYFNLAKNDTDAGNSPQATMEKYSLALQQAYRFRSNCPTTSAKLEIEADYALLLTKDYPAAIKTYESLAEQRDETSMQDALWANWALAGIYSGDWGVDPSLRDPAKARSHLVQILAFWPNSPEAAYIRANLRWDDEKGENQFQEFPQENKIVAAAIPAVRPAF